MSALPYVYLLIHTPSRRLYIGSRVPKGETNDLWCGYFSSSKVVGELPRDEFVAVVLSEHATGAEAVAEEARLHHLYQVHKDGRFLNRATADGNFHTCGVSPSEETRRKISEAFKGKPLSEDHKRKIAEAKRGIPRSPETIRKMSESRKGQAPWNKGKKGVQQAWNKGKKTGPLSEETRRKMSESRKGGPGNFLGRKHSEETKRKMREAHAKRRAAQAKV